MYGSTPVVTGSVSLVRMQLCTTTTLRLAENTQGDRDVILFHIYAS